MATPHGLVVPNVKNCQDLTVKQVSMLGDYPEGAPMVLVAPSPMPRKQRCHSECIQRKVSENQL